MLPSAKDGRFDEVLGENGGPFGLKLLCGWEICSLTVGDQYVNLKSVCVCVHVCVMDPSCARMMKDIHFFRL